MRPSTLASLCTLALAASLASCGTTTPRTEARLERIADVSLEHVGRVAPVSWLNELDKALPAPRPHAAAPPTRNLRFTLYTLDPKAAPALLSTLPGLTVDGFTVDAEQAGAALERATADGVADKVTSSDIALQDQSRGLFSVIGQTAYVSSFELLSQRRAFVADPEIEVAQDGLTVDVHTAGDTVKVTLTSSHLERPIPVVSATTSFGTPLRLQVPMFVNERLTTEAEVPLGQALFLTSQIGTRNGNRFALMIEPVQAVRGHVPPASVVKTLESDDSRAPVARPSTVR